uniref:30S ribosomal protein S8 n=1 Tax=Nephromyces sp. ex Molgula occidentalis TaxID=2544991 RepID=A0A5C1H9B3_9APIC|nr:30S ribosomal protein S8 [Nephromyces sp. ex Molgula occidentalis]
MNYINLLIKIKNSYLNKKFYIYFKYNNFYYKLLTILKFYGYIKDFYILNIKYKKFLFINLKNSLKKIIFLKFFKYNHKLYFLDLSQINILNKYYGLYLISTSKGIISVQLANKLKLGGNLICYIW